MDETAKPRSDVTVGLLPAGSSPPVEWRVSDGLTAYDHALAVMAELVDALA